MIEKKREDRKASKQYRGLTGAGLAQGKDVSVEAVPRLTGKLGLLKEGLESVEVVSRLANLILIGLSGKKEE